MSNELARASDTLRELASTDTPSIEQLSATIDAMDCLKAATKELSARFNEAMIEHLQEHGEFTIGHRRYYLGVKKTTKCANPKATVQRILEVTGGDLDKVLECLVAQPFKPGATRTLLDGDTIGLFEERIEQEVREGKPTGKAKREVKVFDTRFKSPQMAGRVDEPEED